VKEKSELYPKVSFEKWKSLVSEIDYTYLNLYGVLQTSAHVHFFFEAYGDKKNKSYSMAISKNSPYQVLDEGTGHTYSGKYFRGKKPYNPSKRRGRPPKPSCTWKFWDTKFVQEINKDRPRSKSNKPIFEYLVMATDDWITFVSSRPATWRVHPNLNAIKAIQKYIKEGYQSQKK
jgi:hypothetical protein